MNPKSRDKLQKYINQLASILGLKDWSITLEQSLSKDCEAEITPQDGNYAKLKVSAEFFLFDRDYQRLVIVHELCHLHCRYIDVVFEALKSALNQEVYGTISDVYESANEHAVEAFSRLLAEHVPMPPNF